MTGNLVRNMYQENANGVKEGSISCTEQRVGAGRGLIHLNCFPNKIKKQHKNEVKNEHLLHEIDIARFNCRLQL